MQVGRETGLWTPLFNDCHVVVRDALDACSHGVTDGQEMGPSVESSDGGVSQ